MRKQVPRLHYSFHSSFLKNITPEQEIPDEKLAVAYRHPSLAPLDPDAHNDEDDECAFSCICDIDREGGELFKDQEGILVP